MQGFQLHQRDRRVGAGQRAEPVLARVGDRGQKIEDAAEAGLLADELDVRRVVHRARLRPAQGQLVELAAFVQRVVLALRWPIQPGDLKRAVAEHVAVHHLGAAQRVDQPAPGVRADEPHRHPESGLVQRRDPAGEHVLVIAHGRETTRERDANRRGGDALVENLQHLPRG